MREMHEHEIIIVPGPETPEHASDPALLAAALGDQHLCEPALTDFDDYGPTYCYSPERRLRQISRGEIRQDLSPGLTLVDMDAPTPRPAWMPRWTLQFFRNQETAGGVLIWTAIVLVCLGFWGCVGLGFWGLHIVLTRGHL